MKCDGHVGALITCLCVAEQKWVCWGLLGRPAWPEAGAMKDRTGMGQTGNSGGISLGQLHSLEL